MNTISSNMIALLLIGVYLFYLYFNSTYKSYIGLSVLCFVFVASRLIFPDQYGKQWFIIAIPLLVVTIISIIEAQRFQEQGKNIFQPTKKNIFCGLILFVIYILLKIYYFDN